MTLESIKTGDKNEAVALFARYCESPEELYVRVQCLNGEHVVEVLRPPQTAADSATPDAWPEPAPAPPTGR